MKKTKDDAPFTFWDDEKQVSELHWKGHVLTGTNEATLAVLTQLNDFRQYRAWALAAHMEVQKKLTEFLEKL